MLQLAAKLNIKIDFRINPQLQYAVHRLGIVMRENNHAIDKDLETIFGNCGDAFAIAEEILEQKETKSCVYFSIVVQLRYYTKDLLH